MQDVVQRTENFVLWPLIYRQWNNLVTTSVYLHFISLIYMCLPNYWLKDISDKQMFYFRSILKSRKQMTKYSDPADICRYNLLKQSLKLPQVNSICKLGHHSNSFMIPQWVFSTNLGLEAGGLSIGKNSTTKQEHWKNSFLFALL